MHYHSTSELLRLVTTLSCTGPAYRTYVLNKTADELNVTVAMVNAAGPVAADAPGKLRVLLTFGIHGREVFSGELAHTFLTTLCDDSSRSRALLGQVAFAVFPVLNPSGRKLTDGDDVQGRRGVSLDVQKCSNRRKNFHNVDLNRNFDLSWDLDDGSSPRVNDDDYRGEHPFSEVETATLKEFAAGWQPDMYIDLHTGTLAMYTPWNWVNRSVANEEAAKNMSSLLAHVRDAQYPDGGSFWDASSQAVPWRVPDMGIGANISYIASGTAADYLYLFSPNIKYVFLWEMYEDAELMQRLSVRDGRRPKHPRGGGASLRERVALLRGGAAAVRGGAASGRHSARSRTLLPATEERRSGSASSEDRADGSAAVNGSVPLAALGKGSAPATWSHDECFRYFNPVSNESLKHWLGAWNEALMVASERLAVMEGSLEIVPKTSKELVTDATSDASRRIGVSP